MYLLVGQFVETVTFLIGIPVAGTLVGPWVGIWVWKKWISLRSQSVRRPVEKNDMFIGASIGILIAMIGLGIGLVIDIILVFLALVHFSAS